MKTSVNILLGLLLIMVIACKTSEIVNITYTDQNNNRYFISEQTLRYDPIKELESSSGTYSGGDPVSVNITSEQLRKLREMAQKLVASSEGKTTKREMLTSVLALKTGDSLKSVILKKSEARAAFEKLLLSLKQ